MQLAITCQCLGGESFVEFHHIEIHETQPKFLFQFVNRWHGSDAHDLWIYASRRRAKNSRQRFETVFPYKLLARQDHRRSAISNARRVCGGDGAGLRKNWGKLSHIFHRRARKQGFVLRECGRTLLAFYRDRNNFVIESSTGLGSCGALLRYERKRILLFTRDLVLLGESLSRRAHHHLCQRAIETVLIHAINNVLVA